MAEGGVAPLLVAAACGFNFHQRGTVATPPEVNVVARLLVAPVETLAGLEKTGNGGSLNVPDLK